jgi:hypothetical protein
METTTPPKPAPKREPICAFCRRAHDRSFICRARLDHDINDRKGRQQPYRAGKNRPR